MRHKGVTHSGDSRRPRSAGPRDAETPPTLNLTHISHAVSLHLHFLKDYHPHPNWFIYAGCLHEWCVSCLPMCSSECHSQKEGEKKTIKDVTNCKKKETITPLSGDETDILYSPHLQYHSVFFFTMRLITKETLLLGCSVTQCLSTLSRCSRQGGLMPNAIDQHCSSSKQSFLKTK